MTNEKEYLELYSFKKLNSFANIGRKENISSKEAKNKYKTVNRYIGIKLGFEDDVAEKEAKKLENELKVEIKEIQKIFTKFKPDRKKDFNDSFKDFYIWFKKQKAECFYCKTQKNDLESIFNKKIITSKKFNSTLHIEKKDSKKAYSEDNMVLACALCNNAKSDMISENDYKTYFAESMKKYLSQCKDKANA